MTAACRLRSLPLRTPKSIREETWQARRLARNEGRNDVTALPFGINTVSLVAFVFLIMGPVYRETGDASLAWRTGLFACLLNGLMEIAGAIVGGMFRRITPRVALLSSLAGIAITFIAMGFIFQIFASPAVALVPVFLILAGYGGKVCLPLGLPAGFVAVLIGAATTWILHWAGAGPGPDEKPRSATSATTCINLARAIDNLSS